MLTPVTVVRYEILESGRIWPKPRNALKIRNIDSSNKVTQLNFLLLLCMSNDHRHGFCHSQMT
jgi:hypothetical protein